MDMVACHFERESAGVAPRIGHREEIEGGTRQTPSASRQVTAASQATDFLGNRTGGVYECWQESTGEQLDRRVGKLVPPIAPKETKTHPPMNTCTRRCTCSTSIWISCESLYKQDSGACGGQRLYVILNNKQSIGVEDMCVVS
eukprot:6126168-Amphidinium_carterae.1